MLTPYRNPINEVERSYNRAHKKDRVTIERCFAQLKRRFPMLNYEVRLKLDRVASYIMCGFILHNIAKYLQDPDDFEIIEEYEQPPVMYVPEVNAHILRRQGINRRAQIAQLIYEQPIQQ